MSQTTTKATNRCGTEIEVGQTYILNEASEEQACTEPAGKFQVKVVELKTLDDGRTIARLSYPRDGKHDIYLEWTPIDRLYEPLRVSGLFGSVERFFQNIRRGLA